MNNKKYGIFCGAQSLLGDIVCYLPILNILERHYPGSTKVWSLAQKCSHAAPFLLNHPLIDKIQISEPIEGLGPIDLEVQKQCYCSLPINPPVTEPDYFNRRNIVRETARMYLNSDSHYDSLPKEEQFPRLSQWFKSDRRTKTIALWPFAGYGMNQQNSERSPNVQFWNRIAKQLSDSDYYTAQFGHPLSEPLAECVADRRKMPFFEAIQKSLGFDLIISSDTGAAWYFGAYGHPQIVFYTNYKEGHVTNLDAFVPLNYKNNLKSIYFTKNCENLADFDIVSLVKEMT